MTKLSDVARITLEGMDTRVNETSSLAEQATLVYEAARRFARAQGFNEIVYLNQYPGYEGPLVMKRLVTDLFPNASREQLDSISSAVNQVLKRSMAARCTLRPGPNQKNTSPVWFIALEPPGNMADIAAGAATLNHRPHGEQLSYAERRLTEHEAGEDREPAEVTVVQVQLDEDDRIFEEVATSPTPITITELTEIVGLPRWRVNTAVNRLILSGRLFSRIETAEEGLVRTDGRGKPHARKPRLLWPSEPVPSRTALPRGVTPQLTSQEWTDRRSELNRQDEERILEYLVHPPKAGRSTGKIARAVGVEHHRTKRLLDSLVERGTVRLSKPAGLYYLATDPQRPRRDRIPASNELVQPTPKPVKAADPAAILEQFVASSVAARTAELEAELEAVKSERDALKARLDRIQKQFE